MLIASGCGKAPSLPAPVVERPEPSAFEAQASYCERLQPLLDKTVRAARIGTEMACLDMPGITELGRYGPAAAGEEEWLANCFDDRTLYDSLIHAPEAPFEISIDEAFLHDARQSASVGLSSLVPWLPRLEVNAKQASQLAASVTIRDARFITLVGLASKLQGQTRERRCMEALCKSDYTYVHKALIGVPRVVVSARDSKGQELAISPLMANLGFADRELSSGSREIASTNPVTLAVARSAFRTAQTERLCQFCGKQGQPCCNDEPACDGGLGCVAERCAEVGGPGQPCDGEICSAGCVCVGGSCRVECGGNGQPCCSGKQCAGKLRCSPDPHNTLEQSIHSEVVEVDGGFFGTDEDRTFGTTSCGALRTRARYAITKIGSGRGDCKKVWWFEPKNDKDCRVGAHFSVGSFGTIQCRIEVFATPPPKPDLCTQ